MNWTETTFDTGEVRLHVLEGPASGPPLVFLHGATSSHATWLRLAPHFAEYRQVFLLDLRGHNLSSRAGGPRAYHLSGFVADIAAFLRERAAEPAVLVGHSLGAVVALLTAADPVGALHLRGVVAEDPPLSIFREDGEADVPGPIQFFTLLDALKQRAQSWEDVHAEVMNMMPDLPPGVDEIVTNDIHRLDPAFLKFVIQWGLINAGMDLVQILDAIACPVLLMQADPANGAALSDRDAALAREWVKRLDLLPFPGAGHGIHDEQPDKFLAALEGFLRRL